MVDISYRVIARTKHSFDVEMAKPSGPLKMIEGFGSEHEAKAWNGQAQRMIRTANPRMPLPTFKPPPAPSVAPRLPPLKSEQPRLPEGRTGTAARRVGGRAAGQGSLEKA